MSDLLWKNHKLTLFRKTR